MRVLTPGFVMSLFAEQYRPGRAGPCDPHELGGNLCRCTGYRPIRDAALSLGMRLRGISRSFVAAGSGAGSAGVESAGAPISRPANLDECLAILAGRSEARLISADGPGGGIESTGAAMDSPGKPGGDRGTSPIFRDESSVTIGAALPLNEIAKRWSTRQRYFPHGYGCSRRLRFVIEPPSAGISPLLRRLAMARRCCSRWTPRSELASGRGRRTIPLASFFTSYRRTALAPDELITAIEIPKPLPEFVRF